MLRRLTIFIMCVITSSLSAQIDSIRLADLFSMDLTELMSQTVITSSKFNQGSLEAPASITVITSDEIKAWGVRTLAEALSSQRGFFLTNDRNYMYAGTRGFSIPGDYNNRILILVDGHTQNEVVYGSGFIGNELAINIELIDRIEIVRGPGSSIYGSGAMLNVINVITRKGGAINGVEASTQIGSFGSKNASALFGKKSENGIEFVLSGSAGISDGEDFYYSELDDPETNNGLSERMDWERFYGLSGSVSLGNLSFTGRITDRYKGIPTGAFETDLEGDVSSRDARFYLSANYNKTLEKNGEISIRGYYDRYYYKGSWPVGGEPLFDRSEGEWFGTEARYLARIGKRNRFSAGAELRRIQVADYREWDNYDVYFDNNYPMTMVSAYAENQLQILYNLTLTMGLRHDEYLKHTGATSPRIALVYNYSAGSAIKLLYSQAFRAPNMYESHYASEDMHISNHLVKPERIAASELNWTQRINPVLYASASLYRFTFKDLIHLVPFGVDGLTTFDNSDQSTGFGAEAEIKYRKGSTSEGYINVSAQKTEDHETEGRMPNSPALTIKSGWNQRIGSIMYITPSLIYESPRLTLAGNETSELLLINLGLRSVTIANHYTLELRARNILNTKYYHPGSYEHIQDVIQQDSRSVHLKLTAKF